MYLILKDVVKNFASRGGVGEVTAVAGVSIDIKQGDLVTLLGPSGCGKTTTLRLIAGFEFPTAGQIMLDGREINDLPPHRRDMSMVFQSYAIFPHLNVYENIAYGLNVQHKSREETKRRVAKVMELVELTGYEHRQPNQLSGGQQQRVALARALVNEPEVLLLDEPMSALDARLRAQVQVELRRLQRKLGQTFILVTHDQAEALVVSDRIAVMSEGKIMQFGTPKEVYEQPRTRFVAEFLGAANLIPGRAANGGIDTAVGFLQLEKSPGWPQGTVAIRPERIRICDGAPEKNGVKAKVTEAIYRGTNVDLWLEPGPLRVRTPAQLNFDVDNEVWLELPAEGLVILDE
jgi:spermidine/putrescine transport system ATP-binding protein